MRHLIVMIVSVGLLVVATHESRIWCSWSSKDSTSVDLLGTGWRGDGGSGGGGGGGAPPPKTSYIIFQFGVLSHPKPSHHHDHNHQSLLPLG